MYFFPDWASQVAAELLGVERPVHGAQGTGGNKFQ